MAQVQRVRNSSGKQWFALLALIGMAMAAVLWWWSHRDDGATAAAALSSDLPHTEAGFASHQAAAAQEIERQPVLKPIAGPVHERPAFVSEMEWDMLKGVSQQSPAPDAELTRLVNKLRFMKQLELWQSMAHSEDLAKRQVLAEQLLDDLPQRVASADLNKADAQKLQAALLKDAVTDEQARKKRAESEARRLGASAAS